MARKISIKLILWEKARHMSQNAIASTHHIAKKSIVDVLRIAKEQGITYADVADMTDDEIYRRFYPDKFANEVIYVQPDYDYVHKELKRVGVTLKLLWQEYQTASQAAGKLAFGYTKFCSGYDGFVTNRELTNHLEHKPGETCEVDWSGKIMRIVDRTTGEATKVFLFVATLPYSQYAYVEPCLDCKQLSWLRCHAHMYSFFGGVPRRTVCDNLKTGVISHPRTGEVVLNEEYAALAEHYVTAILPAAVRKPKQKASVEGTVGKIATAIIARLRNETFFDLAGLKKAVREALDAFNKEPFQKRPGSRYDSWLEEKKFLEPLPAIPYEVVQWLYDRKVYPNCHVSVFKNYYSVPYAYVGRKVDIKLLEATLEIYCQGQCISRHRRFPDYIRYHYDTRREDMPAYFNQPEMNGERMCRWADRIGRNTRKVVDRIFESVQIEEQAYNSVLSVLKLEKAYSREALEAACQQALERVHSPRYRNLKAILAQSVRPGAAQLPTDTPDVGKGLLRGANYYGGGNHAE